MTATDGSAPAHARVRLLEWVVRFVVVVALAIDAVVHVRLADTFDFQDAGIGSGNMFRIAAAAAVLSALYLLATGSRAAYAVAFLVLLSAVVAVVLYRYVDVPQIGPIPPMYEPIWFPEKTLSAVAEGLGAIAAVIGLTITRRRPRRAGTP